MAGHAGSQRAVKYVQKMRDPKPGRSPIGIVFLLGLGMAVAALALFAWLAGEVLEGGTIAFDNAVRRDIHQHVSPAFTAVMRFSTAFGSPLGLIVLSLAVLAGFTAAHWRRDSILFLIAMAGGFVLDAVLKIGFHRPRPPMSFFGTPIPHSYSFPSGHALFSVCLFGIVAAMTASRVRRRAIRVAIWLAAAVIAFSIGLSRIYLGVHYPSDVIAGYAAAIVWVSAVAYANRLALRKRAHKDAPRVRA